MTRWFPGCYFSLWAKDDCSGPMDACHVIPKRVLKREWSLANPRIPTAWAPVTPLTGQDLQAILDDRRNIVAACRHHHGQADFGPLDYPIPASVYEFARDYELDHYLPVRDPDVGLCITCGENWCEDTRCDRCKRNIEEDREAA